MEGGISLPTLRKAPGPSLLKSDQIKYEKLELSHSLSAGPG